MSPNEGAVLTATIQGRAAPWYEGIGFGVIDVERFLAHVGGRPMTIARAPRWRDPLLWSAGIPDSTLLTRA